MQRSLPPKGTALTFASTASTLKRLHAWLTKSAGTVAFGLQVGTVSIFGLIFGVAAALAGVTISIVVDRGCGG